jgi:hypothetical protein
MYCTENRAKLLIFLEKKSFLRNLSNAGRAKLASVDVNMWAIAALRPAVYASAGSANMLQSLLRTETSVFKS